MRFQRPSQDPREEVPETDHFRPPGEVFQQTLQCNRGPGQYHRKGASTGRKSSPARQADGCQHQGKSLPLKDSEILGTSLVVQWLRIHLPMQGTWV